MLLGRGTTADLGGVDAVSAARAEDALVGDKSLLETGRGRAVGRPEETSESLS